MKLFFSDLDNTLIYSYKHNIGNNKMLIEEKDGKALSYMTKYTYKSLIQINNNYKFIPITTRTIEQYNRIDFGFCPKYALTSNGGNLLIDNVIDDEWYKQSKTLISDKEDLLQKSRETLQNDKHIIFDIRFVDNLFIFTKSQNPLYTINNIISNIDTSDIDVLNNGIKIYVLPKILSKGNAIKRLKKYLNNNSITYCAGDSLFDISMIQSCDKSFIPNNLLPYINKKDNLIIHNDNSIFSDFIIDSLLK